MVDVFISRKFASKVYLHDMAVLPNLFAINHNSPIAMLRESLWPELKFCEFR